MIIDATSSCGCGICNGSKLSFSEPVFLAAAADEAAETPITPDSSYQGTVGERGDTDVFTVTFEAGKSYMISLRGGGADGIRDPYLTLANSLGLEVGKDDDGGTGINSMITYTPAVAGTYRITAGAFDNGDADTGLYWLDVLEMKSDTVPETTGGAVTLPIGENMFGFIESDGDVDLYKVTLTAGQFYSFEVAGGADYDTHWAAVPPGELDTELTLLDADGNVIASNNDIDYSDVPGSGDISSAVGFTAAASGTYYLRVEAYPGNVGGYALTSRELNLGTSDPVAAIDWGSKLAAKDVTVYFAQAGEIYDGVASLGWTDYEIQQAMAAFQVWADVTDLSFARTTDAGAATFKLVTNASADYLGYFNPPGEANEGVGVFSVAGTGWDRLGTDGGLEQGGYGWITLIHEFGHGIGLAHPHDNGGTSQVMAGVTGPFGSYGAFDLNQGVWTTMSYNDGWQTHPDAVDGEPEGSPTAYGWQGGAGAFDIAIAQAKYGADAGRNAGDTVYTLPTENAAGTFWTTIWDVGGSDTILHDGIVSALIDLTAATLDYSAAGAGVVSFVDGIFGGFTIAGGVLLENATGGSGADTLVGNAAANRLDGRGGADTMIGRGGDDVYLVDDSGDVASEAADEGTDEVRTGLGAGSGVTERLAAQYQLGANIENLTGTSATGQGLRGNALANTVTGGGGDDVLNLGDGGVDRVLAGGGNDVIFYGGALTGADENDGGAGTDTLVLQGSYASLVFGAASLVGVEGISLQSGSIGRWGQGGTASYDYGLATVQANVASGQQLRVNAQSLLAGEDFSFDGSAETDGGRFLVYGGYGVDTLTGGSGNDIFVFEAGRTGTLDRMIGGGGNDAVVVSGQEAGATGPARITIEAGTFSGIEALSFNGRFATDPSARPSYEAVLKNGNVASAATLIVNGSSLGEAQSLSFDGSAVGSGQLTIFGGAGTDILKGGSNADTIYAGEGADGLTGNGGADLFQYRSTGESTVAGSDRILDFEIGRDKIDLSRIDADGVAAGDQGFAFIGGDAFSGVAGELRATFDSETNRWTIEGDVDGNGNADLRILVTAAPDQLISGADFLL